MSDITLGIKLTFDGKPVEGGLTVTREQFRQLASEAKRAGEAMSGGFSSAATGIRSISAQMQEMQTYATSLRDRMLGIGQGGIAVAGLSWAVSGLSKSLLDAGIAADRVTNQLKFVTGSGAGAAAELDYLRNVTQKIGVDFSSAAGAYGKLAAASKGTALEGQRTRDVFEAVAKASTVMGLSAAETDGALLAISQMMSKGTIQAEELRGQLGEHLPGAFNIAARAMGVTTAELGKMLENGDVVASSFLPRFAEELNKTLGDAPVSAAASAQAQLNRLNSSWDQFRQAIANSGFLDAASNGMRILASAIDSVNMSLSSQIGAPQERVVAS